MSRSLLGAVALLVTVVVPGCSNNSSPTAPTTPEVPVITESFAGTLTINGAITHPFVVGTPSAVTATLLTVSPNIETPVGMSIGTWNTQTESCAAVISNDLSLQGRVLIGSAQNSGAFCVRIYDVGRLTEATAYTIQVTHQ